MQREGLAHATWTIAKASVKTAYAQSLARMGAALAFYTIFSIAPLLLVIVGVASLALEQDRVQDEITQLAGRLVGPDGVRTVEIALANAEATFPSGIQAVIAAFVFFFGATAAFSALLGALNQIWGVTSEHSTVWRFVRRRLLAFALVVSVALVLLVSLLLNTVVAGLQSHLPQFLSDLPWLTSVTSTVLWLVPLTLLFATIYRVVPDATLEWEDVLLGGAVTAVLFSLGTLGIAAYIGGAGVGSAFGAASSVVLTLVWVYWSAQIVLVGAAVTHSIGEYRRGRSGEPPPPIEPEPPPEMA